MTLPDSPAGPELVATGLEFPEGPVALADGSVVLVEIRRGTLTRVTADGRRETIAQLGGGPNGAAIGPDGAAYVCNNGGAWEWTPGEVHLPAGPPARYSGGLIQRVDLRSGAFTTLYEHCEGRPLNSPNDLVFDRTGGFWFTCLGYSDGENRRLGAVYYARPDGSKITRWRSELISPNGIGLSPDESKLYMADCMVGRLYEFDLPQPGVMAPATSLAPGRVVSTLPGFQWLDSLAVEADGRICVGTLWNGGITVFRPDGEYEHIAFPDPVTTNICFGGADLRDAWVTCSSTGRLYKCRWPRPGLRLPFNA
ncbi:MAG TPA: SMP-30/gluconolactonase/LRE family protein [Steroidobacteraceae bacterium]|nr:SMP-30/gluconolactonase/LRE family protein [Steroidobacteraceae bacterium]